MTNYIIGLVLIFLSLTINGVIGWIILGVGVAFVAASVVED